MLPSFLLKHPSFPQCFTADASLNNPRTSTGCIKFCVTSLNSVKIKSFESRMVSWRETCSSDRVFHGSIIFRISVTSCTEGVHSRVFGVMQWIGLPSLRVRLIKNATKKRTKDFFTVLRVHVYDDWCFIFFDVDAIGAETMRACHLINLFKSLKKCVKKLNYDHSRRVSGIIFIEQKKI